MTRQSPSYRCECGDPGCPVHRRRPRCDRPATTTVYRCDMEDATGTVMCEGCADDALTSGVFSTKDDDDDQEDRT